MNTSISRRLSIPELSERILEMAKTGVYRQSIFEALSPLATKKNIRLAIAHAKSFGLHSVADLRDDGLGTYYQVDLTQYHAHHPVLNSPLIQDDPIHAVQVAHTLLHRVKWVVRLSMASTLLLVILGAGCGVMGYGQLSGGLELGALIVAGMAYSQWRMVRQFFKM